MVVLLLMPFLFHTTSYLSTTEPLGTLQEREMVVAVVELTVTLGWPGTEESVDIHHSPHVHVWYTDTS